MIAVIDYGMGNVASICNAFAYLGFKTVLTSNLSLLDTCSSLILPGVGAFGGAAKELERKGMLSYLQERRENGCFILGICLGLQLFFERSEEEPDGRGLAYFKDAVRRFHPGKKVPHMGWNRVYIEGDDPLFKGVPQGSHFYFAHSFYAPPNRDYLLARCCYGVDFAAAVKGENIYGLQFHPEKSGKWGLKVLLNFGRMVEDVNYSGH